MAVLVFAESDEGKVKKGGYEATSFGRDLAGKLGSKCVVAALDGITEGEINALGKAGAQELILMKGDGLTTFSPEGYATALKQVAEQSGSTEIVISATLNGKSIAPRLAVLTGSGIVTGVIELPDPDGFVVKKSCFSNKAFTYVSMTSAKKLISLIPNSYEVKDFGGMADVSQVSVNTGTVRTEVKSVDKVRGKIPLTEAEIVVSGGRGLKGPENWGMVEELAEVLGGATACSKPVADMDWRPHEEHVGQTGITIKPNLYIAIGISGAIQHLAGVGSSKVICVINTDPEAPFFKAADYGIVGDALEVVPKLIARAKELTAN